MATAFYSFCWVARSLQRRYNFPTSKILKRCKRSVSTATFCSRIAVSMCVCSFKCCGKLIMKCWRKNGERKNEQQKIVELLHSYARNLKWSISVIEMNYVHAARTWINNGTSEEKKSRKFSSSTMPCNFLELKRQTNNTGNIYKKEGR